MCAAEPGYIVTSVSRAIAAIHLNRFKAAVNALQISALSSDQLSSSAILILLPFVFGFVIIRY